MKTQGAISGMLPSENRALSALLLALSVAALFHPLFYFNTFSGDAEIHLVYAHNFLSGYPLQFNPGEPSSGQTSMGFMFILVPIMKLFGEPATPLAMKLIGLTSLYVIAVQTYRLGRRLGMETPWPLIAAITTLLLPGSVYNGMLGSENAFFGALVLTWIHAALDSGWLSAARSPSLGRDCLLAIFMGAMFWIRPEAIPFGGLAWLVRGAGDIAAKRRLDPRLLGHGVMFAAIAGAFVLAYVLIFRAWTGILPFGAGYARLLESIDVDSVWFFGLSINVKVLERLAAYASVVLPALYTSFILSRQTRDRNERWLIIFLGGEFFGLMTAYSFNVVTALHFARYTIYAWPLGVVLACYALWRWSQTRSVRRLVYIPVAAFFAMAGYETFVRSDFEHDTLVSAMEMSGRRPHASDDLLKDFGNPTTRPVVIAVQEVQSRNFLDSRFVIRSLDGILDIAFLKYLCHGYNDHDGYFIDQNVDFVMKPFANYNHDRARWSLQRLDALPIGQSIERPGIRYTKISADAVKVTRLVARSTDRPVQPCRIDSSSRYF